jgi:CRISPR-associated endoribonuclease Cas6
MPYSLVLNLIPKAPIPSSHLTGRHLHALFLDLVRSVDPDLGTKLHQQETTKAFTLSPLQRITKQLKSLQWEQKQAIAAGTPCWWRISLLDDGLFGQLAHLWLNLSSQQAWRLGGTELQVASILSSPMSQHPWANYVSYQDLYEAAAEDDRQIHLQFLTPTLFRRRDYDTSLPTPELIFQSLLRQWNQYGDRVIPETIVEYLYPSFFNIRTEITQDGRSKFIGCVGDLTLKVLGDASPETIKQINALADFAFYCGVGKKTPMGMGMLRRKILKQK